MFQVSFGDDVIICGCETVWAHQQRSARFSSMNLWWCQEEKPVSIVPQLYAHWRGGTQRTLSSLPPFSWLGIYELEFGLSGGCLRTGEDLLQMPSSARTVTFLGVVTA